MFYDLINNIDHSYFIFVILVLKQFMNKSLSIKLYVFLNKKFLIKIIASFYALNIIF